MQSTLKTPAATPTMRPKVGRPPVAEVLDHPMASLLRNRKEREKGRFDLRFIALAIVIIIAIALTLGTLLTPSLQTPAAPVGTPAPVRAAVAEETPQGSLVGDFAVMGNTENAVSYSAQEKAVINPQDRQRLLNILSKD